MKKILTLLLATTSLCSTVFATKLKSVKVHGNTRIEFEAILNELPVKPGQEYNEMTAANALKILNQTGYFSNVSVKIVQDDMIITVTENPVINRIEYEGMKNRFKEVLKDIIKIKPRQVFSSARVQETQQIILECYRRQGYLNANVTPKFVKLPDNRIDLVFEVSEGSAAYVRKVIFVGNKSFSSSELRNLLTIQPKQWFHIPFLGGTKNRVYDPEKFSEDQQALIKFYLGQGYADVEIVSATAELSPDKRDFYLTYYINEGEIYKFGDLSVDSKIENLDGKKLQAAIMVKKDAVFNGYAVEYCQDILKGIAKMAGYTYATVDVLFKKNPQKKTVDICFTIRDGARVTIEQVNIKGNHHTHDIVIRRELPFVEGDPFEGKLIKNAEERVKALGFFKNAKVEVAEGSTPQQVVLNVEVEEEHTGEVFGKVGYSTFEGFCLEAHLSDTNFRGLAQGLSTSVNYAQRTLDCEIELTEPQLLGHDLFGSVNLFHSRSKRHRGIIRSQTGGGVGLGYHISRRVTQHWRYKLHRESTKADESSREVKNRQKVDTISQSRSQEEYEKWLKTDDGKAHRQFLAIDEEKESAWGSAISHTIAYDCRDRQMLPTHGFRVAWTTTVSGLGGSIRHLINTWSGSWHHRLIPGKDYIIAIRGSFSHARGLGDTKLRTVDALYLGGDSFRGFNFYGISPSLGFSQERMGKAFDSFADAVPNLDYVNAEGKKIFTDAVTREKARHLVTRGGVESEDALLATQFLTMFNGVFKEAVKHGQKDAIQMLQIQNREGYRLGSTLAWTGSVEVITPMPMLPRDAEVFLSGFVDFGSAWRSNRSKDKKMDPVVNDDHFVRISAGFSIAWNSPFGMINIGYAWPLRKRPHDLPQSFLFGFGTKFN